MEKGNLVRRYLDEIACDLKINNALNGVVNVVEMLEDRVELMECRVMVEEIMERKVELKAVLKDVVKGIDEKMEEGDDYDDEEVEIWSKITNNHSLLMSAMKLKYDDGDGDDDRLG